MRKPLYAHVITRHRSVVITIVAKKWRWQSGNGGVLQDEGFFRSF
jgi:hypothetical protein